MGGDGEHLLARQLVGTGCGFLAGPGSARELGLRFDLDFPPGIEQSGDDHHRGDGTRSLKQLAVDGSDGGGIIGRGEEHAGADDVIKRRSGFAQRGADDRKAAAGLLGHVIGAMPVGPDRPRPGDEDAVSDPKSPAEAELRLERRPRSDVPALGMASR